MAVALHELMAVVLVALLAFGRYMMSLPDVGFDMRKIVLILFHKQLGLLALALAALRLAWRVGSVLRARNDDSLRSAAHFDPGPPSGSVVLDGIRQQVHQTLVQPVGVGSAVDRCRLHEACRTVGHAKFKQTFAGGRIEAASPIAAESFEAL